MALVTSVHYETTHSLERIHRENSFKIMAEAHPGIDPSDVPFDPKEPYVPTPYDVPIYDIDPVVDSRQFERDVTQRINRMLNESYIAEVEATQVKYERWLRNGLLNDRQYMFKKFLS